MSANSIRMSWLVALRWARGKLAGWRRMDQAPRDGTHVLIWGSQAKVPAVAYFDIGDENDGDWHGKPVWTDGDGAYWPDPVAWKPLPAPPAEGVG